MATDPSSYLSASIIIGVFSIVALFGGIAIPLIEKGKLNDQITADQMLTREESLAWGAVPGNRNISYQKAFTIYSLSATNDQLLGGNVNAVTTTTALYNYSYEYSSLQFAPASNGSIQFFKAYNHTYAQNDEDSLKTIYVTTANIGAFRGATQQADMSQAQIFIQSLYKIYTSFQQNIINLLYADNVFEFYIKNQTLTNNTIFMYQNTVSAATSNQLWSDPDYGWSKASTLVNWVLVAQAYASNNPTSVPQYNILKNHFSLTDNQMSALAGGQMGQSSLLFLLIKAVISTLSGQFTCASPLGCTPTELFALQFFSASLTKEPVFEGIPSRASVAQINQTYPAAPEIAAVNPNGVSFEATLATALFGMNSNNNGPAAGAQSLFGLKNVEYIIANQNNAGAVMTYLSLDNTQQAQVLIDYVNYLPAQFSLQNQTNLQAKKYTADIAVTNMNNLTTTMGPLMSINITAMGVHNLTQSKSQTCAQLLSVINASPTLVTSICDNPDFTLDSAHGLSSWVAAYYGGEGSSVFTTIETVTGIADSDLQTLMNPTNSPLAQDIQTVVAAISTPLGCGQGPCDNGYLVSLQWATSGFTMTLPTQYFGDVSSYRSISDMMPGLFTVIPEFSAFYYLLYGSMPSLTVEQGKALFSYNVGSINNNYEVLNLLSMAQNNNYTGIQTRFNLNQNLTDSLFVYFDELFIYYYLGGLVQTTSVYNLLWGYTDPFLSSLNNQNFFENVQLFDPTISLLGEKDSSDDSSDTLFSMINSGSDNEDDVRKITSFNNNVTLSLNQTYYDGNIYYAGFEPVWGGPLQYISGTDGSGFAPLMEEKAPVTIFEGPFLRNLNYNYQSTNTDSNWFDFYTYQLDTTQFAKSDDIYYNNVAGYMNLTGFDHTPLLVSLPFYTACDAASFAGVTFDGQIPTNRQSEAPLSTFVVESLSGVTANYTKSYQYNIYNLMPFFLTKPNNPVAIPLFQVSETYVTPSWNFANDLQGYYTKSHAIKVAMIVVLVIAFLMFVTAGVLGKLYYNARKQLVNSRLNVNPGDFASLGVDSDGAGSTLQPLTMGQGGQI